MMKAWWLLLVCLLMEAHSVMFNVRPRYNKCLTTDVEKGSQVIVEFQVLGEIEGPTNVQFLLEDPKKTQLAYDANVDSTHNEAHEFSFKAEMYGIYAVCFANANDETVQIALEFKHGVEATDYSEVAKREHLMPVEKDLRKLEDTVAEIHREMLYVRDREAAMRDTSEATNSRVKYLNGLTILILLGVGVWQITYLKQFFKSKKLI